LYYFGHSGELDFLAQSTNQGKNFLLGYFGPGVPYQKVLKWGPYERIGGKNPLKGGIGRGFWVKVFQNQILGLGG